VLRELLALFSDPTVTFVVIDIDYCKSEKGRKDGGCSQVAALGWQ
jgi:hypothetical protein